MEILQDLGPFGSLLAVLAIVLCFVILIFAQGSKFMLLDIIEYLENGYFTLEAENESYVDISMGRIKLIYKSKSQKEVFEFFSIGCDNHSYIYFENGTFNKFVDNNNQVNPEIIGNLEAKACHLRNLFLEKVAKSNSKNMIIS